MLSTDILVVIGSFIQDIDMRRMLGFTGANKLNTSFNDVLDNIFLPRRTISYRTNESEIYSVYVFGWGQNVIYKFIVHITRSDSSFEVMDLKGRNKNQKWRLDQNTNSWFECT